MLREKIVGKLKIFLNKTAKKIIQIQLQLLYSINLNEI